LFKRREAKSSVIKAHGGAVRTVAFSSDGQYLLSGSDDKTIKVLHLLFLVPMNLRYPKPEYIKDPTYFI
jgi:WD40 repeat protein